MSNQQGGPPRGAFGPGQTVLAPLADEAPPAFGGYGGSPVTVRDPAAGAPRPPYGSSSPYDAARPIGIPPPPPPARGRRRGRQGSSLVAIAAVSFLVIGSAVTAIVVFNAPSNSDDAPAPSADAPAPTTVPADPGPASADPPASTDPPAAPVPSYRTSPRSPRGPRGTPTNPRTSPTNPRYPGPGPGQRRPPR
ncbi:Outer membrane protein, OmpA/MotB family protein [Minicystis rosea]|nr:Outer membrane protein, OmpA/MotB family protein [Minicystis rosea]